MTGSFSRNKAIAAVLIIAAIVVVIVRFTACSTAATVPQNTYDWSRLYTYGEFKTYVTEDGEVGELGVDVSSHNGDIDWSAVAGDGVSFAYVRVGWRGYTEGNIHEDEQAAANIEGALAAGLECNIYFFSQAITEEEAQEEANFACDFMDEYGLKGMTVAYDLEECDVDDERIDGLTTEEYTNVALAFCEQVNKRGYQAIVYGNDGWLDGNYDLTSIATQYDLWLADYGSQPEVSYDFVIWQYSSTASISGISGECDINLRFPSD